MSHRPYVVFPSLALAALAQLVVNWDHMTFLWRVASVVAVPLFLVAGVLAYRARDRRPRSVFGPVVEPQDAAPAESPPNAEWHNPSKRIPFYALITVGVLLMIVPQILRVGQMMRASEGGLDGWWMNAGLVAALPVLATAWVWYHRYGPRAGIQWQQSRGGPIQVDLARQHKAFPLFLGGVVILLFGLLLANTVLRAWSGPVAAASIALGMAGILGWALASRAKANGGAVHPDDATRGGTMAASEPGPPSSADDLDSRRLVLYGLLGLVLISLFAFPILPDIWNSDGWRGADGASVSAYGRTMEWQTLAADSGSGDLGGLLGDPRQATLGPFDIPADGEQLNVSVAVAPTLMGPSVSFRLERAEQGDWEIWHEGAAGWSYAETMETQGVQQWRLVLERSDTDVEDASFEWGWTAGTWVDPGQCVYRDGRLDDAQSGDGCPETPP